MTLNKHDRCWWLLWAAENSVMARRKDHGLTRPEVGKGIMYIEWDELNYLAEDSKQRMLWNSRHNLLRLAFALAHQLWMEPPSRTSCVFVCFVVFFAGVHWNVTDAIIMVHLRWIHMRSSAHHSALLVAHLFILFINVSICHQFIQYNMGEHWWSKPLQPAGEYTGNIKLSRIPLLETSPHKQISFFQPTPHPWQS